MCAHLLECTGLSMRFGGLMALQSLDIHVDSHEVVGLVGPNGSGKTTFFNVVTGIYHPCAGKVMFNGQDITGLSPQEVYQAGIARTFQRSRLCLDLTVFDNIMVCGFWPAVPTKNEGIYRIGANSRRGRH